MNDSKLAAALSKLDAVQEIMSVRRVFGEAYQVDGVSMVPVVAVRGGGGGGGGEGTEPEQQGTGSGAGMGFGVHARPVGVFVVKDGTVTWSPAIDVTRIVQGGQLVALVAIITLARILARGARGRH